MLIAYINKQGNRGRERQAGRIASRIYYPEKCFRVSSIHSPELRLHLSTFDSGLFEVQNAREKRFAIWNILSINLPHQFSSYLVNLFNYISDLLFSFFLFSSFSLVVFFGHAQFRIFLVQFSSIYQHFACIVVTCVFFFSLTHTHILIYVSPLRFFPMRVSSWRKWNNIDNSTATMV